MAIVPSDLVKRLATTAGAAGDTTAGTPAGSLGKYVSTTVLTDATLANLFDTITGPENTAEDVEYRCLFILNNHGSLPWTDVVAWISSETAGGAIAAIGVDTTASSAKGSAGVQALTIANESTAPVGVSFSSPTTKGAGLSLGTINAGAVKAIWIRRTAQDTPALASDSVVIAFEGDSAA